LITAALSRPSLRRLVDQDEGKIILAARRSPNGASRSF